CVVGFMVQKKFCISSATQSLPLSLAFSTEQPSTFRPHLNYAYSEKSVRNTIGITVSANFPVAVFIRHIT
ncbi:TPA: hypothetical protein ACHJ77_005437, partial [Escherichia coli]